MERSLDENLNQAGDLIEEVRSDIKGLREQLPYMFEVPLELIPEEEFVGDDDEGEQCQKKARIR